MVELATGKNAREEWFLLPRRWKNPINRKQVIFVSRFGNELGCFQNFALFGFYPWYRFPKGTGDFMVINFHSRVRYWIQKDKLQEEIRLGNP